MAVIAKIGLPDPRGRPKRLRSLMILCASGIGILFFVGDVLGLINHGGLFSVLGSYGGVVRRAPFVDVDGAGLRTLFLIVLSVLIFLAVTILDIDIDSKAPQTVAILTLVGGAFIADAIWDEPLVTNFMTAHGYSRCLSRDHEVGVGKSRVWFHDYALTSTNCPPRRRGS